jgi:hypothetical protein
MREQLNPTQLEALKFGNPLSELLKFWLKRMGQKELMSGHARRAISVVTDLP